MIMPLAFHELLSSQYEECIMYVILSGKSEYRESNSVFQIGSLAHHQICFIRLLTGVEDSNLCAPLRQLTPVFILLFLNKYINILST